MSIKTLVSHLAICAALGILASSAPPALAQTDTNAPEVSDVDTPRSLRDLRVALREGVSGAAQEQIFSELEVLGQDGNAGALMTLGNALRNAGDIGRAIAAYEAAAELDEISASVMLMRIFGDADSPFHDPGRATATMLDAAEAGNAAANFALARALLEGNGVDEDPVRARQILLDLSPENTAAAQLAGDLFRNGTGGPVNPSEAARLYRLAAEGGRDIAWLRLGTLLQAGEGIAPDPEGARDAFERAAAGAHVGSAARARLFLLRGHVRGEFGAQVDPSVIADLATDPLNAGDIGIARLIVSDATYKVPAEMLSLALDILNTGANDGNQGAARTLFSYWMRERSARPAIAEVEINRIIAEHEALLNEGSVLRLQIEQLAPRARTIGQYQELSGLLLNASGEALPAALVALRRSNANAYVHALQSLLEKHGFYSGSKNGLLTAGTIAAISRLCTSSGISQDCAQGPLRGPVARSIGGALAELG